MNPYNVERTQRAAGRLGDRNLDAFITGRWENYIYLSGFTGTSATLLLTPDKYYLITDFRYTAQAKAEAGHFEVVTSRDMDITLGELLKNHSVKKLGFESAHVTYDRYMKMKEKFTGVDLIPVRGFVEELRAIKDQDELERIGRAVEIADDAFSHILGYIRPGIRERDVARELESYIRGKGGTGTSFETIVASGVRSAMPHGVASDKIIMENEVVTLDFGAVYGGYCSDMTRTIFVKGVPEDMLKIYELVLLAQEKAAAGAHRGMTGFEIDNIAREIINEAGYGDKFGHGLGHGVGLNIHEDPRLSLTGTMVMENNMVVSIEPGIYIEGKGGVRIEDLIVIRDETPVILTKSVKDVIIV